MKHGRYLTVAAVAVFISLLILSIVGCRENNSEDIVTDVDAETVFRELDIVPSDGEDLRETSFDLELQSGFSRVIAVKLSDDDIGDVLQVNTSNPLAVTAVLLREINGNALVEITAKHHGSSSVTVSTLKGETETLLDSLTVFVPQTEIYGAEFSAAKNNLELMCGETYVDTLTVYSSGHLIEDDLVVSSSDTAIASAELSGVTYGDYYTTFGYTVKALSVGSAVISARLFDGTEILLEVSVSEAAKTASTAVPDTPDSNAEIGGNSTDTAGVTYILNTNSRKFHNPECRGVRDMKEQNKSSFYGTRDEILAMGYSPCGTCKP